MSNFHDGSCVIIIAARGLSRTTGQQGPAGPAGPQGIPRVSKALPDPLVPRDYKAGRGPAGQPGEAGAAGPQGRGWTSRTAGARRAWGCSRRISTLFMQGGFQDVAPEGSVRFLIAFQSGDFSFTPNTTEITVNTAGVYRIDYSLLVRPAAGQLNIAYAVAINGLENPLSFLGLTPVDLRIRSAPK